MTTNPSTQETKKLPYHYIFAQCDNCGEWKALGYDNDLCADCFIDALEVDEI